jgi:3-deoxy-manno-octulosonate cytidylyltransferase (CMP-KDO synthetase)
MKIAAIIPSRYGSTRFSGKPLALIANKPMIQMVFENVKQSKRMTDVVVATDDQRICDVIKNIGGDVIMTSSENKTGTDRVAEAALKMGLGLDDIVVNVQGDQPLIDYRCLDDLVEALVNDTDMSNDVSTLACKIVNKDELTSPDDSKVVFDSMGFALYFSRAAIPHSRDHSVQYDAFKHIGVYAYSRRFLEKFRALPEGRLERVEKLELLRALEYGHKIKVVITEYDSPEVDWPEDLIRIENILSRRLDEVN